MKKYLLLLPLWMALAMGSYGDRGRSAGAAAKAAGAAQHARARVTVERQRTVTGFTREQTISRPDGQSATRSMTLERDPETHSVRHEISGTNFDAETYSRSHSVARSDGGSTIANRRTGRDGEPTGRVITTTVDPDTGTVTKTIEVTDTNGEVHTKTIVQSSDEGE